MNTLYDFVTFPDTNVYKFTKDGVILEQEEPHYSNNFYHILIDYEGNVISKKKPTDEEITTDSTFRVTDNGTSAVLKGIPEYTNCDEFSEMIDFEELKRGYNETTAMGDTIVTTGNDGNAIVYLVGTIGGPITDVLIDSEYLLQQGDSETKSYILNKKHLLIWNMGDAC